MNGHQAVRLEAAGPEMQCPKCREWWPLEKEYWLVAGKWRRVQADQCRSCERERSRLYQALKSMDPEFRAETRDRKRRYRAALRRQHPELLTAYDRLLADRAAATTREWRVRRAA